MATYRIYIKSDEHPRTINTPKNGRCWYSVIEVKGNKTDLIEKVKELKANGKIINEIRVGCGGHKVFI